MFFGHNLGATIAFEVVAPRLPDALSGWLTHLFASAKMTPSTCHPYAVHRRDDAGVVVYLREVGGMGIRGLSLLVTTDVAG